MNDYASRFQQGDLVNFLHGTTVHEVLHVEQSTKWPDTFYAMLRSTASGRRQRVSTKALRRFFP